MPVFDCGSSLQVPVSPEYLSRLLNLFGEPLDGRPVPPSRHYRNILTKPGPLHEAKAATEVLETGIKVIDLLCPFIHGGKTGLFGEDGVGKTVLIMEFMDANM
jgi:F-type H+-transporting ATPase subunit beta